MRYSSNAYPRRNWGRRRRSGFSLRWIPILLFAGYFAFYYLSHQESVPITGRSQLVDIDRQEEMQLGLQSWAEIESQSRLIESGHNLEVIRNVGARIARAAANEDPGFDWEFNLIDSDQMNAFCLPGGKVAFYTGILPIAQNADGVAAIMGHEIAHAIARHGAERMAYQKLVQFGSMAASVALGDMDFGTRRAVMGAMGAGSQFGILLPFSRKHESEADYIGLMYLARACFDPREAPKLWERMQQAGSGSSSEFSSTHPSPETRIENFRKWMPEALKVREQYCGIPAGASLPDSDMTPHRILPDTSEPAVTDNNPGFYQ
ncbi:MAG TPA: M48 family peptidase [Gammaproteobacteria bacterium]|nr:M48 family peptidase [Gammaproteobacteria bacterium]